MTQEDREKEKEVKRCKNSSINPNLRIYCYPHPMAKGWAAGVKAKFSLVFNSLVQLLYPLILLKNSCSFIRLLIH
jgi:hypothetical protein